MELNMAVFTALTLFLLVSAVHSFHDSDKSDDDDLQRKYSMVVNEVEDLRASMKTMKEDMQRLSRVSRALDALCEELRSGEDTQNKNANVPGTEQLGDPDLGRENTSDTKDEYTTMIQATSLQTNDDTFQVEYNSTKKAEVWVSNKYSLTDNTFNFDVVNNFSDHKGVVSGLIKDDERIQLVLTVGEYDSLLLFYKTNNSKITMPRLKFETDTQRNIVFNEGESASVEIRMDKEEDEVGFFCALYTASRNESETVLFVDENPEIVNKTEMKEYLKDWQLTVVVNEGQADYEGVLYMSLISNSRSLPKDIMYFSVSQTINVMKAGHTKPFSDRFLGFVIYSYQSFNITCDLGSSCPLSVTIMGDGPADITLWNFKDGMKSQMDILNKNKSVDYILYAEFMIYNITKSDAGLYMYRGTSHVGTVIEKKFEIKVQVPYTVIKDQSEVLEDTPETLVVKCVVRGDPDPQIRFYNGSYTWRETEITEGPGVSIQFSDEKNYVSSATLTIDQRTRSTDKVTCAVQEPGEEYPLKSFQVYTKT